MAKASTSHGIYNSCLCTFALKNHASFSLPFRWAYSLAPVMWFRMPASVTIQSWSSEWGAVWLEPSEKTGVYSSDHGMWSLDCLPAVESSRGARREEHPDNTRARTLYAPTKE